jgi:hypothetical protein
VSIVPALVRDTGVGGQLHLGLIPLGYGKGVELTADKHSSARFGRLVYSGDTVASEPLEQRVGLQSLEVGTYQRRGSLLFAGELCRRV